MTFDDLKTLVNSIDMDDDTEICVEIDGNLENIIGFTPKHQDKFVFCVMGERLKQAYSEHQQSKQGKVE